jgi:bacterioferritin-associated ferredoxin
MIVCHCEVVRARTIERVIRRGASTIEQIGAECGAGTNCAGCHTALCDMLEDAEAARYESVTSVAIAV